MNKIKLFVGVLALLGFGPVQAALVQVAEHPIVDSLVATGITDLEIGDKFFDVDFELGSFNDLNIDNNFPWIGDEVTAIIARDLINDLLNEDPLIATLGDEGTAGQNAFWIPYDFNTSRQFSVAGVYANPFLPGLGNSNLIEEVMFATFSPVSVPEPSIIALMFTGLIGLGLARRKVSA